MSKRELELRKKAAERAIKLDSDTEYVKPTLKNFLLVPLSIAMGTIFVGIPVMFYGFGLLLKVLFR